MITRQELNPKGHPENATQAANLDVLCKKLNEIRKVFGRPMAITSGLRSWDEHVAIYLKLKQIEIGLDGEVKLRRGGRFPKSSQHLIGAAADVSDPNGLLWGWLMDHKELVRDELGLYLEDKSRTPTWVHFQLNPPRSGNWIFLP